MLNFYNDDSGSNIFHYVLIVKTLYCDKKKADSRIDTHPHFFLTSYSSMHFTTEKLINDRHSSSVVLLCKNWLKTSILLLYVCEHFHYWSALLCDRRLNEFLQYINHPIQSKTNTCQSSWRLMCHFLYVKSRDVTLSCYYSLWDLY